MNYIVVEMQTNEGTTSTLTNQYSSFDQANQKYHQILSYASVSTIDCHSAVMLDENGMFLKSEGFRHDVVPTENIDYNGQT